jgi:hypothetical protein
MELHLSAESVQTKGVSRKHGLGCEEVFKLKDQCHHIQDIVIATLIYNVRECRPNMRLEHSWKNY